MTRTLFFFTATAAMLATMTAILIRIELSYPGVSPLFLDESGVPDEQRFNTTSIAHSVFAYLTAMLLGTTMIAAARDQGARLTTPMVWLGTAISFATAVLLVISAIDAPALAPEAVGWVLYPPRSVPTEPSVLHQLISQAGFDPSLLGDMSSLLLIPATGLITFGAFALLSTEPGFRVLPFIGLPLVLLSVAGLVGTGPTASSFYNPFSAYLAIIALLACASIRLIDAAPAWLVVMTLGVLASIVAHGATLLSTSAFYASGTMTEVALRYIFPLGMTFYALPALILFTRRPQLHPAIPWVIGAVVTIGLIAWLVPLLLAGQSGQPMRYLDYPQAYETQNIATTVGVFLFAAGYLALITWLRRKPRG